jgi:hypothetical protein
MILPIQRADPTSWCNHSSCRRFGSRSQADQAAREADVDHGEDRRLDHQTGPPHMVSTKLGSRLCSNSKLPLR